MLFFMYMLIFYNKLVKKNDFKLTNEHTNLKNNNSNCKLTKLKFCLPFHLLVQLKQKSDLQILIYKCHRKYRYQNHIQLYSPQG